MEPDIDTMLGEGYEFFVSPQEARIGASCRTREQPTLQVRGRACVSHQQQYTKAIVEALSPKETARQVEEVGVAKARAGVVSTLALGVMAGAFIGLGGVLAGTIGVSSELGTGPTRLLMGLGLTMALFMVVITGAELFTGNNMMLMGLFSRRVSLRELGRNWGLVYVGNLAGAPYCRIDGLLRPMVGAGGLLVRRVGGGHR